MKRASSICCVITSIFGGALAITHQRVQSIPDVWFYIPFSKLEGTENIYSPITTSMQYAFAENGATPRLVFYDDSWLMLQDIQQAVADGRRQAVVGVDPPFGSAAEHSDILKNCSDAGAYLILYQTEPEDDLIDLIVKEAERLGAREIWDYSWRNMRRYEKNPEANLRKKQGKLTWRYLPPGYAPAFEVGVKLDDPSRDEQSIGYMGNLAARGPEIEDFYNKMFQSKLVVTQNVWTNDDLRNWLSKYPVQLNTHRNQITSETDTDEGVGMEAFRMAPLLSNKACVLSSPASTKDMHVWSGVVQFASMPATLRTLKEIKNNIQECQLQSYKLFKERFDAAEMLKQSNFFDAWNAYHRSLR